MGTSSRFFTMQTREYAGVVRFMTVRRLQGRGRKRGVGVSGLCGVGEEEKVERLGGKARQAASGW